MRFHIDEDMRPRIAVMLRAKGVDAVSAREAGTLGLTDEEQLDHAAAQGRCLVTRNRDHFAALNLKWFYEGRAHSGILLASNIPSEAYTEVVERLLKTAQEWPEGLPPSHLAFL